MNNSEIIGLVLKQLKAIDPNTSDNLCPQSYAGGKTGGCFGLHEDAAVSAERFYQSMLEEGFKSEKPLRQDYLEWRGILLSPSKNKSIILNIRTTVDVNKNNGTLFNAQEKGYKTLLTFEIVES